MTQANRNEIENIFLKIFQEIKIPLTKSEIENEARRRLGNNVCQHSTCILLGLIDEDKLEFTSERKIQVKNLTINQHREDLKNALKELNEIQFEISDKNVVLINEKIMKILKTVKEKK